MLKQRLKKLDKIIENMSSEQNAKIVEDHVANLTVAGNFSQNGMWKLKKSLHPLQSDPPMAKYDKSGNLITAPPLLRKLYLDTYVHRLRHREIRPELTEVYRLKTTLWNRRLEVLKSNKTQNWTLDDLTKTLKGLKNNKARDPDGYINEIFNPNVIGSNLKGGLLHLANGVKEEQFFP